VPSLMAFSVFWMMHVHSVTAVECNERETGPRTGRIPWGDHVVVWNTGPEVPTPLISPGAGNFQLAAVTGSLSGAGCAVGIIAMNPAGALACAGALLTATVTPVCASGRIHYSDSEIEYSASALWQLCDDKGCAGDGRMIEMHKVTGSCNFCRGYKLFAYGQYDGWGWRDELLDFVTRTDLLLWKLIENEHCHWGQWTRAASSLRVAVEANGRLTGIFVEIRLVPYLC